MKKKVTFPKTTPNVTFPDIEAKILRYWKANKIFEKSILTRPEDKTWTFLDGPPFITGLPHYGSLLSSIPKDVFPRFWTMKGYRVRRVWGWDCHGLPAENKVESKLGLKRKRDIEDVIGIKKFINECKLYVNDISDEWEWYVDHIARWVDFKNAYRTMDVPYMESVMWVFKQMYEKKYIYKGLRVSLYCPHCSTPISNFEVAMDQDNYKSISETTAVYKYKVVGEENTFLLAWSTTPWNKLATTALAINPTLTYIKVKQGNLIYILAKDTQKMLVSDHPFKILAEFLGKELVGTMYEPHYSYFTISPQKKAYTVVPGEFVTSDEGTGIVTIAAYGEEDLLVMQKENIHIEMHVDDEGMLKEYVPKWGGMFYLKSDPLILEDLSVRDLIYRKDPYTHTVPTCWRCHTRLIYAPQNAWYVNVQILKNKMKKTNESVHWYPKHFKYGRYLKSLEHAPDWCISRSRYWGSPVPVWECGCGERFVPGSIAELESRSGRKVAELHKPDIDEVTVTCEKCHALVHRVPEVLDSWIEAGSASFAERHYPFDKKFKLPDFFPPDFIVEYTGQIRAWFYVLHVISTALFNKHAFKNVVVTGVILGNDGRKMSKNYGNYPDPKEMIQKYGGDALRLYLLSSPVMHAEDILISEEQYRNQVKGFLLILWNSYNFLLTYARNDNWTPKRQSFKSGSILDEWIFSRLNVTVRDIAKFGYESYDTPQAVSLASVFLQDLSTWYIRRIRKNVDATEKSREIKNQTFQTLWYVLSEYIKVISPLVPFIAEEMYRGLTGETSVHLASWPKPGKINSKLENQMSLARDLVGNIHSFRKKHTIKVRIPIRKLEYYGPTEVTSEILPILKDEVNVYDLKYNGKNEVFTIIGDTSEDNLDLVAGKSRELIREIQVLRKAIGLRLDQKISLVLPNLYNTFTDDILESIKHETLATNITWGDTLEILTG